MSHPKIKLIIGERFSSVRCDDPTHQTKVVVAGTGDKDFNFPENSALVGNALKRYEAQERKVGKSKSPAKRRKQAKSHLSLELLSDLSQGKIITVLPPGENLDSFEPGTTLLAAADGMQILMTKRQFDALYEERFGQMSNLVNWAKTDMASEFQPAVESLGDQLNRLEDSYREALPHLITELAIRNADFSVTAIIQRAVDLLDEELAEILYVLQVYTDCFEQRRNGKFSRILNACEYFFKCIHQLYWSGDLEGSLAGAPVHSPIKAGVERVGDVFLARLTGAGLATIPGSRGPVGAHALQVPYEMLDFILVNFPLFCHEARHNVYHDVVDLEKQSILALQKSMITAVRSEVFVPSVPTIQLGRRKVATEELLLKIYTDSIGEIDADILAVLFTGEAFGDNMAASFPAMSIRDGAVSSKKNLLRTSSYFELIPQNDGTTALEFEVHPVDYVRLYLVAAAYEEIGFPDAAFRLRKIADFAVGDEIPEFIMYENSNPKSKLVIKVPTVDLIASAQVVAKSIIRTPHKCLGGNSNADLVMWTAKRQEKVLMLRDTLIEGDSAIPTDSGTFFVTYVAAAATLAYMQLVRDRKMVASDAAKQVSENALLMLETLQVRARGL